MSHDTHWRFFFTSVLVVTVGVAVNDRPAAAPSTGPWSKDLKIVNDPTFAQAISAVSQQLLAVGLTPALSVHGCCCAYTPAQPLMLSTFSSGSPSSLK